MKSYLRYEPAKQFGVISAPNCNIQYDYTGSLAFTGAIQEVNGWNLRQAAKVKQFSFSEPNYPFRTGGEATVLQASPKSKPLLAVGYSKGTVRLFNYTNEVLVATLHAHRASVSALCFDHEGVTLVSGGADSDIVVWDLVTFTALCRLRGHKDVVTALKMVSLDNDCAAQLGSTRLLVSASKDTLLKVWDVDTQVCVQTVVGHRCEVWALAASSATLSSSSSASEVVLVTGAADNLLRGYRLRARQVQGQDGEGEILEYFGSVERGGEGSEKCAVLCFSAQGDLLAAQSGGKAVELFKVRTPAEVKKKCKRRLKRKEDKEGEEGAGEGGSGAVVLGDYLDALPQHTIRCSAKVRSFAFDPSFSKTAGTAGGAYCKALVSLINNSLEVYHIPVPSGPSKEGEEPTLPSKLSVIDLHGHRTDVRAVSVSGDGTSVATASAESIKVWSTQTQLCLGTCKMRASGYCLCVAFAPGGRYLVAGSKEGSLQIFDSASGEGIFEESAAAAAAAATGTPSETSSSGKAVWAIAVRPDGKGFMSGGADQKVTFWDFSVTAQGLSFVFVRQLQLSQDVLSLRYSPAKSQDKLLVAVGLLDSTVRLYYDDSLKFFLSLYGHKLPIMCLDISYDCSILVSGSADKTVKIWGLDFGDCHRSLIAHEDSVTSVVFQPHTHYFFSAGKDGTIKYWDADRFEQILLMPGHRGSTWGLDISRDGSQLYSVGQDRSVRLWERGEDLVFVEEERERFMDAQVDKAAEAEEVREVDAGDTGAVSVSTLAVASKSIESVKGGEAIMQALDLVDAELGLGKSSKNPQLLGLSPYAFMLRTIRQVKAPDLDQALLVLPFHYVAKLLAMLVKLAKRGLDIELCTRCAVHLLRCHQSQLLHTEGVLPDMIALQQILSSTISAYRDVVGFNVAGVTAMKRQCEEEQQGNFRVGEGEGGGLRRKL